jgi:hypothetical protein
LLEADEQTIQTLIESAIRDLELETSESDLQAQTKVLQARAFYEGSEDPNLEFLEHLNRICTGGNSTQ